MTIKPIRTDDDLAAAIARIEALWGAAPGSQDGDELDVLATFVDSYERVHWPEIESDPIDCLRSVMAEDGHSQNELARLLGSRSRASEVLNRRRALTTEMIHVISRAWHVPADLLVKPYPLAQARPMPPDDQSFKLQVVL